MIRVFYKPDIIFLVYGQEWHKRVYWPKWRERWVSPFGLIGFIRYQRNGERLRGIMLASTTGMEQMKKFPSMAVQLTDQVKQCFPQVQAIALAGQLPGWLVRGSENKEAPKPPLIGGMRGTCFTVRQAVRKVASRFNSNNELCVAVAGGAGHTGTEVVRLLAQEYGRVIAFDLNIQEDQVDGNIVHTKDPSFLSQAQVVVVLTAKGDDIKDQTDYISSSAIVLDDTHPTMGKARKSLNDRGVELYKITVADGSSRMFPCLPQYRPGDVPGCLLETIVVSLRGPQVLESQEAFDAAAKELGFKPRLELHPEH